MHDYSLSHVSDDALLRDLAAAAAREADSTVYLLTRIAAVDARQLYADAGYPSMFAFCVDGLHLSEDAAAKRIHAARAARRFPVLFSAVAERKLHVTAVRLLAPHITTENVDELIAAATHKRRREIEELLARRFPSADVRGRTWAVRVLPPSRQDAPGHVDRGGPEASTAHTVQPPVGLFDALHPRPSGAHAPEHVGAMGPGSEPSAVSAEGFDEHAPGHVGAKDPGNRSASGSHPDAFPGLFDECSPPASSESGNRPSSAHLGRVPPAGHGHPHEAALRFLVRFTIGKSTHDKLRRAQALLSHALPSGDLAQLFDRALDTLIHRLEKQKFAADEGRSDGEKRSHRSRRGRRPTRGSKHHAKRYIPSHVRRAVWRRDGGQCTFVSGNGVRCNTRTFLEFDHVRPVGQHGTSTTDNVRLRCRAHNQLEAKRVYGDRFMRRKRRAHADGARRVSERMGLERMDLERMDLEPMDLKRMGERASTQGEQRVSQEARSSETRETAHETGP